MTLLSCSGVFRGVDKGAPQPIILPSASANMEQIGTPSLLDQSPHPAAAVPVVTPRSRRLKQLDLLRALAILLVLGIHCRIDPNLAGLFAPVVRRCQTIGWIGVDCFFVLSGFLIGGLIFAEIQRTGSLDYKRFFLRRAFKIWPQYYSYLIFFFFLGITCFGYSVGSRLNMMLPAFLNVQNYSRRWESQLWSLAVEEHFYLLLPLAIILVLRFYGQRSGRGMPSLVWIGIFAMIGGIAGRFVLGSYPFNLQVHYFGTHARLDALEFGVLIAYASVFHKRFWDVLLRNPLVFGLLAILFISPVIAFSPDAEFWFAHTFGYTFLYVGFGALLIFAMGISQKAVVARWLEGRLAGGLAWIGLNSYGIYLWHEEAVVNPLAKWLYPSLTSWPGLAAFFVEAALVVAGSVLVGALTTVCIERPMLALRDRVWPSRSPRAAQV